MSADVPDPTPSQTRDREGVERIADPDQYSHRRRLRQIHDAKERVLDVKSRAVQRAEYSTTQFTDRQRDRLIAEAVVDYIAELEPVLQQNENWEAFASEPLYGQDVETTIEQFLQTRGTDPNEGYNPYLFSVSMKAWRVCNRYFEQVAGAEFEQGSLPSETGFNPVGDHS